MCIKRDSDGKKVRDREDALREAKGFDEKVTSIKIRVEFERTGFERRSIFFIVFAHERFVSRFFY